MRSLRVGMAQINCTVGDLGGNTKKIIQYLDKARKIGVELICFPELAITGYPPEDLLLKPRFIEDNLKALKKIIQKTVGLTAVVGFVDKNGEVFNAAAIIHNKKLVDVYYKSNLPNYGVFDEYRYFQPGEKPSVYQVGDFVFGVNICEDIWYPEGPAKIQALIGEAELIVNINASPYHMDKWKEREKMLSTRASDNRVFILYNNLVGGQDELVFDGMGMIFDPEGKTICRGKQFEEDFIIADLDLDEVFRARLHDPKWRTEKEKLKSKTVNKIIVTKKTLKRRKSKIKRINPEPLSPLAEVYKALVLGTKDYLRKNGFSKAVLGLSGGIDSALVAVIAKDALGKENVISVFMPSEFTSKRSLLDAKKLAHNLGTKFINLPIRKILETYISTLSSGFKGKKPDVTEENLQARIRGNLLMALSNKFGWLVLTTGNKSELAAGYSTLYGDMVGGFVVLKDIPKTLVYKLARHRNSQEKKELIPEDILKREPTAELKPGQKDTDTLPPYPVLDPILKYYVEEDKGFKEIKDLGFNEDTIIKVMQMVDRSEYKRRQAPPGIKITARAFGKDRRLPITNKYKEF
ncbi:MAG: NAD+ synthase [candidate division Zixibacteria bacterium]|nr:NAD+ synthase [candidate division Zixibacteria bacterium]